MWLKKSFIRMDLRLEWRQDSLQPPSKFAKARPHIIRLAFTLSMILVAVTFRKICITGMISLFCLIGLYMILRGVVLITKEGSRLSDSIDWVSNMVQFGMIPYVFRIGSTTEVSLQLVFIMPLLSVVQENVCFSCLRVLIASASLARPFTHPETYFAILLAQSPFIIDFSVVVLKRLSRQKTSQHTTTTSDQFESTTRNLQTYKLKPQPHETNDNYMIQISPEDSGSKL